MADIGILEAKTHLSSWVDRACAGEEVTITRHGKRVARLVPVGPAGETPQARAVREMFEFMQRNRRTQKSGIDPVKLNRQMRDEAADRHIKRLKLR